MSLSLPALATTESFAVITPADFDQIMRQYQRKVYRVIFLVVKNAEDADNLTQECFLRAYSNRERFRGECSLQTWLLRIAMNLARDHLRSRRVSFWRRLLQLDSAAPDQEEVEPLCPQPSIERELVAREELDAVWRAVDGLSTRQKEIFILRFIEEMELKEIADILNLRIGTVKTQLFRAVNRVREQVGR